MKSVEKFVKIFIVEDINGDEQSFLNEMEAIKFEEEVLITKQREKIRIFCKSAFPESSSRLHNATFSVDDIVDGIFSHINLLKQLDI